MTKFNIDKLCMILDATTTQFRKGAARTERTINEAGLKVIDVYVMPHVKEAPADLVMVDVHFMEIGVDKAAAERHRADLLEILDAYPEPERLAGGPSYIEVGGIIGDQGRAFQLFALGQALELWRVITPKSLLGEEGERADRLAGSGMIMITGYKK